MNRCGIRPLWQVEKEAVVRALDYFGGNRTHAAKALGISLRGLRYKLAQYRASGTGIKLVSLKRIEKLEIGDLGIFGGLE